MNRTMSFAVLIIFVSFAFASAGHASDTDAAAPATVDATVTPAPAEVPVAPAPAEVTAPPASSGAAANTPQEKALRHKEIGDGYRMRGEVPGAAQEYAKALALYDGFSTEDRYMMSQYLSWDKKLDEAIRVLEKILSEEPGNLKARIHLARCLSWNGDQNAALAEASKALAASPGNKDALLVRANALRWSGNQNASVSIYKEILEKEEDFDTRMALSQAYLADEYLRGARNGAELLDPEYPYQEKEVAELRKEIKDATRSEVGAGYSFYSDSDSNRVNRYNAYGAFWTGYLRWRIGYLYTDASDPVIDSSNQEITLSVDSRPLEWLWVGGTIGYSIPEGDPDSVVIGGVRAGTKFFGGRIDARVNRGVLTDTSTLIDNRIWYTEGAVVINYPLPYRFSLMASFAGRDYSDDNRSIDAQGMLRYVFGWQNPAVGVGYRFQYLDFDRESGGGYFDPSGYMSHRLDVSFNYTIWRMYAYLDLFGGYQYYDRYAQSYSGFFEGWEAVLGMRVTDSINFELHSDGSSEAGGVSSGSGFHYYLVGARVRARF